jgi:hypothetical protein
MASMPGLDLHPLGLLDDAVGAVVLVDLVEPVVPQRMVRPRGAALDGLASGTDHAVGLRMSDFTL